MQGPLALILHGFPGAPEFALPLVQPLIEAGYQVVIPWLAWLEPGRGEPKKGDFTMPKLADQAWALAEHFARGQPLRLITHDFGSLIAYELVHRPEGKARCQALVTMAIPHPRTTIPSTWLPLSLGPLPLASPPFDVAWKARHFFSFPRLSLDALQRALDPLVQRWGGGYTPPLTAFREAYARPEVRAQVRALYRDYAASETMLEQTLVPTLALYGLRDGAAATRPFRAMGKYHQGPLEVVAVDAGHFLLEERPEVVVPKIMEFLQKA